MTTGKDWPRELLWTALWAVVVGAGGMICLRFWDLPAIMNPSALLFFLLTCLAENVTLVDLHPKLTVSASLAIIVATMILFGPGPLVFAAAFATVRFGDLRGRLRLTPLLFNRGQLALAGGLALAVYDRLGATVGRAGVAGQTAAAFAAGGIFFLANITAVSLAASLKGGRCLRTALAGSLSATAGQAIALICLGILCAHLYSAWTWTGIILVGVPLVIAVASFRRYIRLNNALLASITSLVLVLEARDKCTHGHSSRMAEYALAIARELRFPPHRLEQLRRSCLLHDIGKIGIPDAIMDKPGPLSGHEHAVMATHPVLGATVVGPLEPLVDPKWIAHHHERYDGTGYPSGLKGGEVPLGSRIAALADAFDAMTTARPYRPAKDWEEAIAEIRANAGTQFDPMVVEAFLRSLPKLRGASARDDNWRVIPGVVPGHAPGLARWTGGAATTP